MVPPGVHPAVLVATAHPGPTGHLGWFVHARLRPGETVYVGGAGGSVGGELRVGRRVEESVATELPHDQKLPVLREYLRRWAWEVGAFFEGITSDSADQQLLDVADGFPVFRVARP